VAELRSVLNTDIEAVCTFLAANMGRGMTKEEYRPLFTYPWMPEKPSMGYLLEEDGRVVGFLGAIYSHRIIRGKCERFCNLTNWCVLPAFRNESLKLLFAILGQGGQTIINLSPSHEVQKMLNAMRYSKLDLCKLFSFPLSQFWTLAGRGSLLWDPIEIGRRVDEAGRKVIRDHSGTGCRFLVIAHDGVTSLIVSKKRRKQGISFTEILHVSTVGLFRRNFERVKLGLLLKDRTMLLAIDERLLQSPLPLMLPYHKVSFLKSSSITPQDVDNLYSEIAVL
jgi:acetoacetyl-CoA synthetase